MAGWCELFEEVGRHLEQQLGYASEAYTEYAIERLSTNVRKSHLEDNTGNENADIHAVIESYDLMCDYPPFCQPGKTTRVTLLMRLRIVRTAVKDL